MPRAATDIGHLGVVLATDQVGEQADHGPVDAIGREHLHDMVAVQLSHLVVAVAGGLQTSVIGHSSKISGTTDTDTRHPSAPGQAPPRPGNDTFTGPTERPGVPSGRSRRS